MADLHTVAPDVTLPLNATDQRGSAHFQEISYKYYMAMNEIFLEKFAEIAKEREALSGKEKLMKFAQPGYKFVERKDA